MLGHLLSRAYPAITAAPGFMSPGRLAFGGLLGAFFLGLLLTLALRLVQTLAVRLSSRPASDPRSISEQTAALRPASVGVVDQAAFVALVGHQRIERKVAATTYRYLAEVQQLAVPPLPGDHLMWDLGLTEAELEQTVTDLARRLHKDPTLGTDALPATVADLLSLLQAGSPDLPLAQHEAA